MQYLNEEKFINPRLSFVNNMLSYDKNNADGKLDNFILKSIKNFANVDFYSLIALISTNEIVKKYCYLNKKEYKEFWDVCLMGDKISQYLKNYGISELRPQKNIHSLDLIRGFWFLTKAYDEFGKAEEKKISTKQSAFFISLQHALSLKSYQAGCLLLHLYGEKRLALEFKQIHQQLYPLVEVHGAPGYVLLAKLYLINKNYQHALVCLEVARNLLADSGDALHNAQISKEVIENIILELSSFSKKNLNEETIQEAIEVTGDKEKIDKCLSVCFSSLSLSIR